MTHSMTLTRVYIRGRSGSDRLLSLAESRKDVEFIRMMRDGRNSARHESS